MAANPKPRIDVDRKKLASVVSDVVNETPVYDIHTHLYAPAFGSLLLWGIDELLVYHYLVSEAFRCWDIPYGKFWARAKTQQAELIWDTLFLQHSPISEACRGVITTLQRLGIDAKRRDLKAIRQWFVGWKTEDYTTRCLELARVHTLCMTNSPFDDQERLVWLKDIGRDRRFTSGLRLDPLLLNWPLANSRLAEWGYPVMTNLSARTVSHVRRFLEDWTRRTEARYLMVSVPPDFAYPGLTDACSLLEKAVLPHCREHGLPFALMMGVKRAVNPNLRLAGDGVGLSRMDALENLCAAFPENRFLATVLAREGQHALCVIARKFRNLHPFGCWWFTNTPFQIDEITRLRLELLGLSMTPQHSDARVLDQIIYKWAHFRAILASVLTDKYADLAASGWPVSRQEIARDVQGLLGGEFIRFCGATG